MRRAVVLTLLLATACEGEERKRPPPGSAVPEDCQRAGDEDGNGVSGCDDPACSCSTCGDGVLDEGEACDGGALGGATCASMGRGEGTLLCDAGCSLDDTGCFTREDCARPGDEDGDGQADCADATCLQASPCLSLVIVSAPEQGFVTEDLVLRAQVRDARGEPLAGRQLLVDPPAGAIGRAAVTGAEGLASIDVRLGRRARDQVFTVRIEGGPAVHVTVTAVDPPDGTVHTILNASREEGSDGAGPALAARGGVPIDLAAAQDGTLYVAEACRLLAVDPEGVLTLLGGGGGCGDPGPTLEPGDALAISGIALHGRTLHLSDRLARVVRALDLDTGALSVAAGGGTQPPEDVPATAVELESPGELAIDPAGVLYVVDGERVLRVEDGRVRTLLRASTSCEKTALGLQTCAGGCRVLVTQDGPALVAGGLCGSDVKLPGEEPAVSGLVRVEPGTLVHLAGRSGGAPEGRHARDVQLVGRLRPALDLAGNVLAFSSSRLLRIDAGTHGLSLLLPGNRPAFQGELVPLPEARFSTPGAIAVDARGDAYVADTGNRTVRRIVGLGRSPRRSLTLEVLRDAVEVEIARRVPPGHPEALRVRALDAAGAPLAGLDLRTSTFDPGAFAYRTLRTGSDGVSELDVRAGLRPGSQRFRVEAPDLHGAPGPEATLAISAVPPPAGTLFTAVAADGDGSLAPDGPLAAPPAPITVHDLALEGGRLHLAAGCRVYRLDDTGALAVVAGTGACGAGGDGGPAAQAQVEARRVVAGEGVLYLSGTTYPDRIRQVDLATGTISTLAGGNEGPDPGDGGPARDAVLASVLDVARGPGGTIALIDANLVRVIAPDGTIDRVLVADPPPFCLPGDEDELVRFHAILADGDDFLLLAETCEIDPPLTRSLLRMSRTGELTWLGGRRGGSSEDGVLLAEAWLNATDLARGPDGAILLGDDGRVRRIDPATTRLSTLAGDWQGTEGDYLPALEALLRPVRAPALLPGGRLYFLERGVRLVW